jgi:hypothetical protein
MIVELKANWGDLSKGQKVEIKDVTVLVAGQKNGIFEVDAKKLAELTKSKTKEVEQRIEE